jgi:hypothetical protein
MHAYTATVKVNGLLIHTQVFANSSYDAKLLLSQQYGDSNIITYPTLAK